jgi:hypothetical protein
MSHTYMVYVELLIKNLDTRCVSRFYLENSSSFHELLLDVWTPVPKEKKFSTIVQARLDNPETGNHPRGMRVMNLENVSRLVARNKTPKNTTKNRDVVSILTLMQTIESEYAAQKAQSRLVVWYE